MKINSRKRIFKQLFDIRPTSKAGELDTEKIFKVKKTLNLRGEFTDREARVRREAVKIPVILAPSSFPEENLVGTRDTEDYFTLLRKKPEKEWRDFKEEFEPEEQEPKKEIPKRVDYRWGNEGLEKPDVVPEAKPRETSRGLASGIALRSILTHLRPIVGFALVALILATLVGGSILFIQHSSQAKEKVVTAGTKALQHLQEAEISARNLDFSKSSSEFRLAYQNFVLASQGLGSAGRLMLSLLKALPGTSSITQGQLLLEVGQDIALAGENLTQGIKQFSRVNVLGNILSSTSEQESTYGLTQAIIDSVENFRIAQAEISQAQQKLEKIDFDKLPEEFRASIESLGSQLPQIENLLAGFLESEDLVLKILGHDAPRKYLLLFQNNSEMRPTGGFLGTYGILDLNKGRVQRLFIEGIFNSDGQLSVKVVPPKPIQKISAAWSMHDANWFADFPTSARKVAWFYEKTGGPTVDGVIALTNEVLVRLLEISGPIEMPSYGVVINSQNFTEITQYMVEKAYDKEQNKPKQFIGDLAPKILERVFSGSAQQWFKVLNVFSENLKEKHILLFFFDEGLEEKTLEKGWGGEVVETEKDYLSVVNSNINGYKTDAVIEEEIRHLAEIKEDGSIIDTLTITRRHLGGETHYDWWNKVNSNWLRIYVPKGAELLEAEGHTLEEEYIPAIDYSWFMRDSLVTEIEDAIVRDDTGTYIFQESEKTVFGNWVYVSPGEEVTVTYKYKLPFKVDTTKSADTYSLLVQKQSGSMGSKFSGTVKFPEGWEVLQSTSEDLGLETDLSVDKFYGATFEF